MGSIFEEKQVVFDQYRLHIQAPFIEPQKVPEALAQIDYSTYRKINFQQKAAIGGGTPTSFSIQLFAPGFIYKQLIDIEVVENGKSFPVEVSESSFRVPDESIGKLLAEVGKYEGLRLHYLTRKVRN